MLYTKSHVGAQWLSGRLLDSRSKGRGFEPHWRYCVVVLEQDIYPSLVLVQPRKTCPYIAERLLMGRKKSNQTKSNIPSPKVTGLLTLEKKIFKGFLPYMGVAAILVM